MKTIQPILDVLDEGVLRATSYVRKSPRDDVFRPFQAESDTFERSFQHIPKQVFIWQAKLCRQSGRSPSGIANAATSKADMIWAAAAFDPARSERCFLPFWALSPAFVATIRASNHLKK
jgi:hypothetical protein